MLQTASKICDCVNTLFGLEARKTSVPYSRRVRRTSLLSRNTLRWCCSISKPWKDNTDKETGCCAIRLPRAKPPSERLFPHCPKTSALSFFPCSLPLLSVALIQHFFCTVYLYLTVSHKYICRKPHCQFHADKGTTATINSGRMEITLYALFSCKGDLCICQKTKNNSRPKNADRTL